MGESITSWLSDILCDIIDFYIQGFQAAIAVMSIETDLVQNIYSLFVGLCGVLLVCVVLYRIVRSILGEAERPASMLGMEPTVSMIIIDTIKSSAAVPIMVFIQGFLHKSIIFPITGYLFSQQSAFTTAAIKGTTEVAGIAIAGFVSVLFILFFAIVFLVFFFKMCKFYAELAFFTLATPVAAISIASESFDFAQTWWRKLLYLNLSLLAQVLAMTLFTYSFTNLSENFMHFMLLIGSGALLLKAPAVIEDFFSSSGSAKKATSAMAMAVKALIHI